MLLFGTVYWVARDLWFMHLVLIVAAALTVWAGCRLILKDSDNPIGCLAFSILFMTLPHMFDTTLTGGPGCINVSFLLLAIVCTTRIDQKTYRVLAIVFMCLANLTRPDSWPCTYLIILAIFALRLLSPKRPTLSLSDLWFLLPMGMPLVWVLLDWTIFGDPLFSMHTAQTFGREFVATWYSDSGTESDPVAEYLPQVKTTFLYLFSLSNWLSVKAGAVAILFVAGVGTMLLKQPRILLLVACPFLGTMLFYFVYALGGTLFRYDYLHSSLVCVLLVVSVGLGSLCDLARRVRPGLFGRFIQVALACAVLLFLTAGPLQREIVDKRIPRLKKRSALWRNGQSAIETLDAHVKQAGGTPVILTTKWIPPPRISLQLATEKELFLVERLIAKERIGEDDPLPDLRGRTVYFCVNRFLREEMIPFVQPLIGQSKRTEEIYHRENLVILKCLY
jgi:hypothetical protein